MKSNLSSDDIVRMSEELEKEYLEHPERFEDDREPNDGKDPVKIFLEKFKSSSAKDQRKLLDSLGRSI